MKRRVIFSVLTLLVLIAVAGVVQGFQTRTVSASEIVSVEPPQGNGSGRFTLHQARPGGNSGDNFAWVLDSASGQVVGYRFVNIVNDKKESQGWALERLPSVNGDLSAR